MASAPLAGAAMPPAAAPAAAPLGGPPENAPPAPAVPAARQSTSPSALPPARRLAEPARILPSAPPPAAIPGEAAADAAAAERELLAYADRAILGLASPPASAPLRHQAVRNVAATADEESAPTFEITIGQLEIVAPPSSAKRPPRRPAPRLSLQDYLDSRRVGRR
jgi:hypothetical protein